MSDESGRARAIEPDAEAGNAALASQGPAVQAAGATSGVRYGRRALMFGAAAAGAGVAASVVGGGMAQAAPDASAVQLGKANSTGPTTSISSSAGTGLEGRTSKKGNAGITGFDDTDKAGDSGYGVYGRSNYGPGLLGISVHRDGIVGNTYTSGYSGVAGLDFAKTDGAHGVYGQSNNGHGVFGISFNATGVVGQGNTPGQSGVAGVDMAKHGGNGVYGQSTHGTAVYAGSDNGTALHVAGKAIFKTAGVAHVASGSDSVTVAVQGVTSSSIVLATIQEPQGTLSVTGAKAGSGKITITLTSKAKSSLPVGYFVVN
jgi:hypothetical protein